MTKHLSLALPLIAACVASCAEGVEPDTTSEEAAVKRPDRNVTFGSPIEQDSLETDKTEARLKATDIAKSSTRAIEVKPVLEFPQPPTEHEKSPVTPDAP